MQSGNLSCSPSWKFNVYFEKKKTKKKRKCIYSESGKPLSDECLLKRLIFFLFCSCLVWFRKSGGEITQNSHFIVHYFVKYVKRILSCFIFLNNRYNAAIFLSQNTTPGQNQDFAIQSPASGSPLPAGTNTTGTTDSNNSVQNNTANQQAGGPNTVLRVIVESLLYPVTLDVLHQIFQRFGKVLKIVTFTKNNSFQVS